MDCTMLVWIRHALSAADEREVTYITVSDLAKSSLTGELPVNCKKNSMDVC